MKNQVQETVLIVDEVPDNWQILQNALQDRGFNIVLANNAKNVRQQLRKIFPSLIFWGDKLSVLNELITDNYWQGILCNQGIPVIFFVDSDEQNKHFKVLKNKLNTVDYFTKPIQSEQIVARLDVYLQLSKITQSMRLQKQLLQQKEESIQQIKGRLNLFESVLSNTNDAIIITESQTIDLPGPKIIYVNEAFTYMTGYSAQEVIGKTPRILQGAKTNRRSLNTIRQALEAKQLVRTELINYRKDGSPFWVAIDILPVTDVKGNCSHWVSVQRDITQRKQAEKVLQQAKADAEKASYAKTHFLSHMSHELRTPLNSILGFCQLMSRDRSLNLEQTEYLNIINRSGEHLLNLIDDVLSISKIETGQVTIQESDFDLYKLLAEIQEMFAVKAYVAGLQLNFNCSPNINQYINTDEGKLRQILINLVGNAIKFTSKGSVSLHVSIRKKNEEISSQKTTSQSAKKQIHSHSLDFAVEDTGAGINTEEIDNLFKPFFQAQTGRNSGQGNGLGLSISYELVNLMGGEIKVDSIVGQGSTFSFTIPVNLATETDQKIPALPPATNEQTSPSKQRIIDTDNFLPRPNHRDFTFVEPKSTQTSTQSSDVDWLETPSLEVMPQKWIKKLHQVAIRLNNQGFMELIQQIPENEANLAHFLTELAKNFRWDIIIELTKDYQH